MNTSHSPSQKNKTVLHKERRGFALVLALVLMGFMVLLIISLASIVSLQLRLSRQSLNENRAKQAAKFAAYQALGQIQATLGPDQRITANAMMFDDNIYDEITQLETDPRYEWWDSPMGITREDVENIEDPSISQNRYWVGVWDSRLGRHPSKIGQNEERNEYTKNTINEALTWLVSGNKIRTEDDKTGQNIQYKPNQILDSGAYVRAVSGGSVSDDTGSLRPEYDVKVPLVTLENDPNAVTGELVSTGKETRIAWWVSDEGQKASLNAVAPREEIEFAESINFRLQSLPFYSGIHGLTVPSQKEKAFDLGFDDDDDSSSMARIRNLDDVKQLDILKSVNVPESLMLSKMFFHGTTFDTKGVLVNVKDGGLKKDLTLGLTRKDFGNESEELTDRKQTSAPEYFEQPYGVAGFDFKTSAYPLLYDNFYQERRIWENRDASLNSLGHIFGPQMFGHEDMSSKGGYATASLYGMAASAYNELYSDKYLWKDPGGPLWDQLRSYYNLRSESDPSKSRLSARVQVDDRIGLMPVVKRFQIFYVPSFVNYEGQKYGLRLHIIPLLILYNPYDTLVGPETYYAIRVSDYTGYHSIGNFRFAIGYNASNGYFQCLRDLITETMPSANQQNLSQLNSLPLDNSTNNDIKGLYFSYASNKGVWGRRLDGASGDWDNYTGSVFGNDNYGIRKFFAADASKFSWVKPSNSASPDVRVLPIGYGATASTINYPSSSDYTLLNKALNGVASVNPYDEKFHWMSFIDESNLWPAEMETARTAAITNKEWSARVARVPLYLNNIPAGILHGSIKTQDKNKRLFKAQRAIDSFNAYANGNPEDGGQSDGNLQFLAYDAKGIEPGKSKVFVMESIVEYMGNPDNSSANKRYGGPNGVIEGRTSKSPYEQKNALMKPLEEVGTFGGCFYIDVAHPESEHWLNYAGDSGNYSPNHWEFGSNDYSHLILFDLNKVSNPSIRYINGSAPTTIDEICVDMQDMTGVRKDGNAKPGSAIFNQTPLGYLTLSYRADNKFDKNYGDGLVHPFMIRSYDFYQHIVLTVWMWNKEGFKFSEISNRNVTGGFNPDIAPVITRMNGQRVFTGNNLNSFPDPATMYITEADNKNPNLDRSRKLGTRNFHKPGYTFSPGMRSNRASLRAFVIDGRSIGDVENQLFDDIWENNNTISPIGYYPMKAGEDGEYHREYYISETEENPEYTNNTPAFRSRYYINWLGINPRRHSANYWKSYDQGKGNNAVAQDWNYREGMSYYDTGLGDMTPVAIDGTFVVTNPDSDYRAALHAHANNGRGSIPYGIIFSQPYAKNESGSQPFFNRRLYTNGSMQATNFAADFSGRPGNPSGDDDVFNDFGQRTKTVVSINQVYSENANEVGDGLNDLGYNVYSNGSTVSAGFKQMNGADAAPIHHVLRKTEVVSNPANLSSAFLTFGAQPAFQNWEGALGSSRYSITGGHNWSAPRTGYSIQYPDNMLAPFAIGNSLCPSRIVPDRSYYVSWIDGSSQNQNKYTTDTGDPAYSVQGSLDGKRDTSWYEDKYVIYDMSWHLNNALWDEYFFSTLPYRNDEKERTLDNDIAFPQNPRLRYADANDRYTLNDLYSGEEEQFTENASKFLINGPFNVNSTNIDAWKAVLSTHYGQKIDAYDGSSTEETEMASFHRWEAPFTAKTFTSNSTIDGAAGENIALQGFRALNDDEIEELAVSIVENIKDRGPFYSMSDFVNRVVSNNSAEERFHALKIGNDLVPQPAEQDDRRNFTAELNDNGGTHKIRHMQKGVLQAAIDGTSINSPFHNTSDLIITNDSRNRDLATTEYDIFDKAKDTWENWRGAIGPQTTGATAYLMQQDILARLGSFMTVRSDTFKIRAYGEVRNPISGIVEGKAWCEMIVQRTPEYFDLTVENQEAWRIGERQHEIGNHANYKNLDDVADELTEINVALGRRFKVVSFRWLNEKEI